MTFSVVIPARYASTRLPGKPLVEIAGKPMIQHVYERACESGADDVIIATDDERVFNVSTGFSAHVCMTSENHPSGTDRLAEVVEKMSYKDDQVIVNLQGDEPMMPGALVRQVADNLEKNGDASVATLCERITTAAELFDPHVVKVIRDQHDLAIYFSRAVIPWDRDAFSITTEALPENSEHYRHIGLYAYRAGFIKAYVDWTPCHLEGMEALEQLRVLWYGHKIHVAVAKQHPGHGVDNESDLNRVTALMTG
ncbi:MAG: 3-deoxy-manno-octulosonate cytidylyltransferase [Gammaproteobacteria bacterium]